MEKTRKKFSKNTRLGYPKILKKNCLKKVRKHVFYKQINIVTKNWGKKKRQNFFPETYVYRKLKTMEKIAWKKCENTFFINTCEQKGGKKLEKKIFP